LQGFSIIFGITVLHQINWAHL